MRVFATARNLDSIADLQELGMECFSLVVDDEESVRNCYGEVLKLIEGPGLDYLVNNAGRSTGIPSIVTVTDFAICHLATDCKTLPVERPER